MSGRDLEAYIKAPTREGKEVIKREGDEVKFLDRRLERTKVIRVWDAREFKALKNFRVL